MTIGFDLSTLKTGHVNRGTGRYARSLYEAYEINSFGHSIIKVLDLKVIPQSVDLIHIPFFDPFFLTLTPISNIPYIVTVHDLIPLDYPQHFPKGIRGEIKWQIQRRKLLKSSRIITDSYASKHSICTHLSYPSEKIDVIPLASTLNCQIDRLMQYDQFKKKNSLSDNYYLYVGDVNWNKNIIGILIAFHNFLMQTTHGYLHDKTYSNIHLVMVGNALTRNDIQETREIYTAIHSFGIKNNIQIIGSVSDEELAYLYSRAQATLLPSYAEGFGLPILEAMKYGSPVITSSVSSMKEIAGPSLLCDPTKPDTITTQMEKIYRLSSIERQKIIQRGYQWEKKYSWEKTAIETIRSYEKSYQ